MKLTFTPFDGSPITLPSEASKQDSVSPDGWICQCGRGTVHGGGKYIDPNAAHDTYAARAICTNCGQHVGILRAKVSTLFGIDEDKRIARSYVKIY